MVEVKRIDRSIDPATCRGMFGPSTLQRYLFVVESRMDETKRARLVKTWAYAYCVHGLPPIDKLASRRPTRSARGERSTRVSIRRNAPSSM